MNTLQRTNHILCLFPNVWKVVNSFWSWSTFYRLRKFLDEVLGLKWLQVLQVKVGFRKLLKFSLLGNGRLKSRQLIQNFFAHKTDFQNLRCRDLLQLCDENYKNGKSSLNKKVILEKIVVHQNWVQFEKFFLHFHSLGSWTFWRTSGLADMWIFGVAAIYVAVQLWCWSFNIPLQRIAKAPVKYFDDFSFTLFFIFLNFLYHLICS